MSKSTILAAAALASTVALTSANASAQEFAEQGDFAFGIERAFGFWLGKRTLEHRDWRGEWESSHFGFALGSHGGTSGDDFVLPYQLPRVGVDYFVIDGLSLGGSLGYYQRSRDRVLTNRVNGDIDADDNSDWDLWLFHFRVGYAIMFSDVIGIWPRGGLTYYSATDDQWGNNPNQPDATENELALTGEFQLIIAPVEHVGITLGPVFDLGITGSRDRENPNQPDWDLNQRNIGVLSVGLFGWVP